MITENMFHKCDGFQCDKCGSHNTITILVYTYDNKHTHNAYNILCKDCNNVFTIKDRG